MTIIPPRSGAAFMLRNGQSLKVIDIEGGQVADLLAFNATDHDEVLSNGRTIDYGAKIKFTTGDRLWSNRSQVMLTIGEDTVGCHDFLLTPCSAEMFRILYGDEQPHRGCFGNIAAAIEPHGISPDRIPVAFNVFMNVPIDGASGIVRVDPPLGKPGDFTVFQAEMDLLCALTACSAPLSNGGSFKPIGYEILM
jgi:uncharacterized protein